MQRSGFNNYGAFGIRLDATIVYKHWEHIISSFNRELFNGLNAASRNDTQRAVSKSMGHYYTNYISAQDLAMLPLATNHKINNLEACLTSYYTIMNHYAHGSNGRFLLHKERAMASVFLILHAATVFQQIALRNNYSPPKEEHYLKWTFNKLAKRLKTGGR